MDLQVLKNGFEVLHRKKRWLILASVFGLTSYGAYRVYYMPSVVEKRKKFFRLLDAMVSVAEMVSDSAELLGVISKDVKEFLQSDSDQIPNSLRQISKIANSDEFRGSLIRVSQALTVGILHGNQLGKMNGVKQREGSNITSQVMDKLFSKAGTGFVSVVAGSFARNLIIGYYSKIEADDYSHMDFNGNKFHPASNPNSIWFDAICNDQWRKLIAECIQMFVSTAVTVYLDRTMQVNTYDEFFSGMTNPNHHDKVTDILVSMCKGSVETLVRTSHQVLTTPKLNSIPDSDTPFPDSHHVDFPIKGNSCASTSNQKWVAKVCSTLGEPNNRRLVLDVTGRVTFETVRSVIEVLLCKVSEGFKRRANEVHERGLEVMCYIGAKSCVILTICVALWLHIVGGAKVMFPS